MRSLSPRTPIPFDRPATYQIKVQGRIAPTISDLLGGMLITQGTDEAGHPVTTLVGELRDQASLAGVLNYLYELHLLVITVTRLEVASDNKG